MGCSLTESPLLVNAKRGKYILDWDEINTLAYLDGANGNYYNDKNFITLAQKYQNNILLCVYVLGLY
jgi:hypothetical protein